MDRIKTMLNNVKEINIKSRRDYVMEFSKKTGITDRKVDTFLKMEAEVNIGYDAVILGQKRNLWEGTTYGVDYGEYLGSVFNYFNEDNIAKEKYFDGNWDYTKPNDATNDKLKLEYYENQRKGIPKWKPLKP